MTDQTASEVEMQVTEQIRRNTADSSDIHQANYDSPSSFDDRKVTSSDNFRRAHSYANLLVQNQSQNSKVHNDVIHEAPSIAETTHLPEIKEVQRRRYLSTQQKSKSLRQLVPQTLSQKLKQRIQSLQQPQSSKSKKFKFKFKTPPLLITRGAQAARTPFAPPDGNINTIDVEDLTEQMWQLKVKHHATCEQLHKQKTRNSQLETIINTLYEDLDKQKEEIHKIFNGQSEAKIEFYESALAMSLKRQIWEERELNRTVQEELDALKKTVKATNIEELKVQIVHYQDECSRLAKMLKKEVREGNKNFIKLTAENFQILQQIPSKEERRKVANSLVVKDNQIAQLGEVNRGLMAEIQMKAKSHAEHSNRQLFLIKAKGEQIRMLHEQQALDQAKIKKLEAFKEQNNELQMKLKERERVIKELNTKISQLKAEKQNQKKTTIRMNQPLDERTTPFVELSPVRASLQSIQPNLQTLPTPITEETTIRESKQGSPSPSHKSHYQSHAYEVKRPKVLNKTELMCNGIRSFKNLIENRPIVEYLFHQQHGQQMNHLLLLTRQQTLSGDLLRKIYKNRVYNDYQTSLMPLRDQVCILMDHWAQFALEIQVCKMVIDFIIPNIAGDVLDIQAVYEMISQQALLAPPTVKQDQSEAIEEAQHFEDERRNSVQQQVPKLQLSQQPEHTDYRAQLQAIVDGAQKTIEQVMKFSDHKSQRSQRLAPPSQSSHGLHSEQLVTEDRSSMPNHGNYEEQPATAEEQPYFYGPEDSAEENTETGYMPSSQLRAEQQAADQVFDITENQMLDTAEQILNQLAHELITNGWTVHDVFGQPDEIIKIIPEYQGERNIKILTLPNFIARVYQVGCQDLSQLQLACLMRVLGKPELEDGVRYNELELLLENFGVLKNSVETATPGVSRPETVPESDQAPLTYQQSQSQAMSEEVVFIEDPRQPSTDLVQIVEEQLQPSEGSCLKTTNNTGSLKPTVSSMLKGTISTMKMPLKRTNTSPAQFQRMPEAVDISSLVKLQISRFDAIPSRGQLVSPLNASMPANLKQPVARANTNVFPKNQAERTYQFNRQQTKNTRLSSVSEFQHPSLSNADFSRNNSQTPSRLVMMSPTMDQHVSSGANQQQADQSKEEDSINDVASDSLGWQETPKSRMVENVQVLTIEARQPLSSEDEDKPQFSQLVRDRSNIMALRRGTSSSLIEQVNPPYVYQMPHNRQQSLNTAIQKQLCYDENVELHGTAKFTVEQLINTDGVPVTVVMESPKRIANDLQPQQVRDTRAQLRQAIVEAEVSPIRDILTQVLTRMQTSELLKALEHRGYKQQVKSKTKTTETSVITQEAFLQLLRELNPKTELTAHDVATLRECVQLAPQHPQLWTVKLLAMLIFDIQ